MTMGCGDECPFAPGLRVEDWPLEDPKGKPIERVRQIRSEIRAQVQSLLDRLNTSTQGCDRENAGAGSSKVTRCGISGRCRAAGRTGLGRLLSSLQPLHARRREAGEQ